MLARDLSRRWPVGRATPSARKSASISAAQIAEARGGRKTPRGWSGFCPTPTHRQSRRRHLDISEAADGRPLFICRAGCSQAEVIAALRALGLWRETSGSWRPSQPSFSWIDHVSGRPEPVTSPCCSETRPCEHRLRFELEMQIAQQRGNLDDAIDEVREKYQRARHFLDACTLRAEIQFAIEFGAIVPAGLPENIVTDVLDCLLSKDAPAKDDFVPLMVELAQAVEEAEEK